MRIPKILLLMLFALAIVVPASAELTDADIWFSEEYSTPKDQDYWDGFNKARDEWEAYLSTLDVEFSGIQWMTGLPWELDPSDYEWLYPGVFRYIGDATPELGDSPLSMELLCGVALVCAGGLVVSRVALRRSKSR